jgi:hypothetical protein
MDEELKALHELLKPMAEKAPGYDVRRLSLILMRLIETLRSPMVGGDLVKTEIPPTHHK